MDAFIQRNLDYDDYERGRSALNEAFKRDFPEITDCKTRGSRLQQIRIKIAKIKAERDALDAAAADHIQL